jgi:hypothetical protein
VSIAFKPFERIAMDFTFLNMTLHDGHGGTYKLKLNKTAGTWMDQDPANNEISSVTMGGNCTSSGGGLTCNGGGGYNVLVLRGASWAMTPPAHGTAIHQRDPGGPVDSNWTWTLDSITTEPVVGEYYPPGSQKPGGGCFEASTLVMVADGKAIPINKIARGDAVRVLDHEKQRSFSTNVVGIHETPITESYVVALDKGQEVRASPLQKIVTSAGPVDVGKLRIGTTVMVGDVVAGEVMSIRRIVENIVLYSLELEAGGDYVVSSGRTPFGAAKPKR